MRQMAGRGKATRILAEPLYYTSSGILLFQIWLKLGCDLGETEAKGSNALLAARFSRHKISNKTKQAAAEHKTQHPVRRGWGGRARTACIKLQKYYLQPHVGAEGKWRGKYDIFSLDSTQKRGPVTEGDEVCL